MPAMGTPLFHGTYGEIASALAARIASRRAGSWLGAPVEIIVPSRSASEELARRAIAGRSAIAGLHTVPIEQFARRVLNDAGRYPRVADEAESSLAMELALRAAGGDLASIQGASAMLRRTHRDLRDSGLTVRGLAKTLSRIGGMRNRERLLASIAVWERFEKLLGEASATVEADILVDAATRIRNGAIVPSQVVFGFYDATEVQLDLLRAIASAGLVDSIWLPAILDETSQRPVAAWSYATPFVERLVQAGASLAGRVPAEQPAAAWAIRDFRSPLGEIREVCREIRRHLDAGEPASSIAVVMRAADPVDLALFEQAGRDFELSFRGVPGAPVAGNRIARGVLSILKLARGSMARRDVMEVVRSGLRPGALGAVPELDRLERATRRAKIARGSAAEVRAIARSLQVERGRAEPDGDLLGYASLVDRLAGLTKKAAFRQRGSAWADDLDRWIALFSVESEEDVDAAVRMQGIATLLRRAPFATARLDAVDVTHVIEGAGELKRQEDAAGIWVGDVMRFRGRTANRLFVVRATHDNLPQRRVEDPLLPDFDRTRLGVRAVGDGRDEERFLFASLLASARSSIQFSYAAADSVGRALRPSSFLKDLAIERQPAARREILHDFRGWLRVRNETVPGPQSASERRTELLLANPTPQFIRQLQLAAMHGGRTVFDGYLTGDGRVEARLRAIFMSLSPSSLEQLGECPHRFFMSTLVGARELDEPDAGVAIEPREKGTLDHAILESFYRGLSTSEFAEAGSGELPEALRSRLETEVNRTFDELDEKALPPNRALRGIERGETLASLAEFVRSDLRQLAEGNWLPQEYELEIRGDRPESQLEIAGVTLGINGKLDRIDRGTDGGLRIVDYKSGKASHVKGINKLVADGRQLQTAIYAIVAKRVFGVSPEQVVARILPLRDPEADEKKFGFRLAEVEPEIERALETLVDAAITGRFPAVPSAEACKYCLVRHWCREKHDSSTDGASVLEILREARP